MEKVSGFRMTATDPELMTYPLIEQRKAFLAAEDLSPTRTDLVLAWSVDDTAAEFFGRCPIRRYEPRVETLIEVIADDRYLRIREDDDLSELFDGCSVVRFNMQTWSVSWFAPMNGAPAFVEAVMEEVPGSMSEMIQDSAIIEAHVDTFLAEVNKVRAHRRKSIPSASLA